jgi:hypothetical protein
MADGRLTSKLCDLSIQRQEPTRLPPPRTHAQASSGLRASYMNVDAWKEGISAMSVTADYTGRERKRTHASRGARWRMVWSEARWESTSRSYRLGPRAHLIRLRPSEPPLHGRTWYAALGLQGYMVLGGGYQMGPFAFYRELSRRSVCRR